MFRSVGSKLGATLKGSTAIIYGESSSSLLSAKCFLFKLQNQNVLVESRVISIFNSFCTKTASNDMNVHTSDCGSSFAVSYLINSCGLSQIEAITASKKLNFQTKSQPDLVLTLLKSYGFTDSHISKVITKYPAILQSNRNGNLNPKLDFFISKGLQETDLADVISSFPVVLARCLEKEIIPSFDLLKSIVQSDENVITMIKRNFWILSPNEVKKVMVSVQHLRNEGVPETNISNHLIQYPRAYTADRFEEIVEKVKKMGFHQSETTFLVAMHMLRTMSKASLRKKMNVYKSVGGLSEDQIQSAFRKNPTCIKPTEKKIMEVLKFLVKEMDYDASVVAEKPIVFNCGMQGRIIPRCSVSRVLVSRGLIKENISIRTLATMVDECFVEKYVNFFEQEVPGLKKVFEGQLDYKELLQK